MPRRGNETTDVKNTLCTGTAAAKAIAILQFPTSIRMIPDDGKHQVLTVQELVVCEQDDHALQRSGSCGSFSRYGTLRVHADC